MNDPRRVVDCASALQLLQEWLDGEILVRDAALTGHLQDCSNCAERYAGAEQLLSVFPPCLPADFADSMVARIRADQRQRQWRQYYLAAGSLAAAVLAALWFTWPNTPHNENLIAKAAMTPSLDRQVERATTAVKEWTERTVQVIPRPDVSPGDMLPTPDVKMALQPVTSPFAEAGRGVAEGLEPLANSAKRAATRFWRDLPVID